VPPHVDPQRPSRVPGRLDGTIGLGQSLPGRGQEPVPRPSSTTSAPRPARSISSWSRPGKNLAAAVDRLAPAGTLIWFGQASRDPATLSFFDILGGPQTGWKTPPPPSPTCMSAASAATPSSPSRKENCHDHHRPGRRRHLAS